MKSVNSISGGKTSAYMATHYPADYELFALVLIEDLKCKPKDEALVKIVSDKIVKLLVVNTSNKLIFFIVFILLIFIRENCSSRIFILSS